MFTAEVVAVIRSHMGRLHMSQAELQRRTRIGQSSLSRMLAGKAEVSIDDLFVIAEALDINPGLLLDEAAVAVDVYCGVLDEREAYLRIAELRASRGAHREGPIDGRI